jgi:hypothetical protein
MGIGAFAYYRRVIENQKNRLIDASIKAAQRLNVPVEDLEKLEAAKKETQFSKAVESIKAALPRELYISGHNPLTLLHGALSEGIHAMTDESCLDAAASIRELLFALADRIGQVLKEKKGLDDAISRLTNRNRQA